MRRGDGRGDQRDLAAAVLSQIAPARLPASLVPYSVPARPLGGERGQFLATAAGPTRLRLPTSPAPTARGGWLADALVALRLLIGDRVFRALAVGQLFAVLSAGALLVVLARDH